jgi:hypothetical protein
MATEDGAVEQVADTAATETRVETPVVETTQTEGADKRVSMADQLTARLAKTDKLRDPRPRDEPTGRFKPADKEGVKPATIPDPAVQQVNAEVKAPDIKAPSTLKPEEAAHYLKAPPEVRAIIDRREADYIKGVQQMRPAADLGRAVNQIVQPYAAMLQSEGASVPQAVQSLMSMAYTLRTGSPQQKAALLLNTAKQFNIDLGQIQQTERPNLPPEFIETQNKLAQLEQWKQNWEQQQAQTAEQSGLSAIQSFQSATDAGGKPLYPLFDEVRQDLLDFIPIVRRANPAADPTKILKEAYERATRANPVTFAKLQAANAVKAQASQQAQATQRVQSARTAAGSVTGSPGSGSAAPNGQSIRESLTAAFAGRA